jgi:hypothetical protein
VVAAAIAAFFRIGAYRTDMSIFLTFEALGDSAARIIAFYRFQIVFHNYPFVYQAIRLLGAFDLDNQWSEIPFVCSS